MDGSTKSSQATTPPPASPSYSQAEPAQQQTSQAADHGKPRPKKQKPKLKNRGPLHGEPLTNHPVEVKLARIREAIAAGADINGLDDSDPACHREGRPLDACLRMTHMASGATFYSNVHVIELLLEHGADPRLRDTKTVFISPLKVAEYNAGKESHSEKTKAFYGQVLQMFRDAIAKLEEKERAEQGEEDRDMSSSEG